MGNGDRSTAVGGRRSAVGGRRLGVGVGGSKQAERVDCLSRRSDSSEVVAVRVVCRSFCNVWRVQPEAVADT